LRALTLTTLGGLTYSCKEYENLDLGLGDNSNMKLNLGNPKEELIAFYQKLKRVSTSPNSRNSTEQENDYEKSLLDKLEGVDNVAFKHCSQVLADPEILNLKVNSDKKSVAKALLSKSSKRLSDYMDNFEIIIHDNLHQNIKENNDVSQEAFADTISQIKKEVDKNVNDKALTYYEKLALESVAAIYEVFGETMSKLYADTSILIIDEKKKEKGIKNGRVADFWDDVWDCIVGIFEIVLYVFLAVFFIMFFWALLAGVALGAAIMEAFYLAIGAGLWVLGIYFLFLFIQIINH
jgi:hypothetical protein